MVEIRGADYGAFWAVDVAGANIGRPEQTSFYLEMGLLTLVRHIDPLEKIPGYLTRERH